MLVSRRCLLLGSAALLFGLSACAAVAPPAPDKEAPAADKKDGAADVGDLNLEVTALQVLYDLQVTPAQLKELAELAPKTASAPGPRKEVKVSAEYRRALTRLSDALAENREEGVEDLLTGLDKLRDKESPEFDDVEISDGARKAAPGLLRKLSARQVVAYAAVLGSNFPDPGEKLLGALEKSRELTGKEWRNLRDAVADDVGWLVAGLDVEAEERVREQALALLNKSARLTAREHLDQKADLEKTARALVGKVGPTDVVRNYMERNLAELLSNPRLAAAVALRQRKGKAPAKKE
jgi:hypothetical protein